MRRCVRIAAGNDQSGLRYAEFRADAVHDTLLRMLMPEILVDIVGASIVLEELVHVAHFCIGNRSDALLAVPGRHVMIGGRERLARLAHFAAFCSECTESV